MKSATNQPDQPPDAFDFAWRRLAVIGVILQEAENERARIIRDPYTHSRVKLRRMEVMVEKSIDDVRWFLKFGNRPTRKTNHQRRTSQLDRFGDI